MKNPLTNIASILVLLTSAMAIADQDSRKLVELPEIMKQHMMSNMRDHLAAINEILISLAHDRLDQAADIAESQLGMSSLAIHGASHMAEFMPENFVRQVQACIELRAALHLRHKKEKCQQLTLHFPKLLLLA